jgi:hypothetical protein
MYTCIYVYIIHMIHMIHIYIYICIYAMLHSQSNLPCMFQVCCSSYIRAVMEGRPLKLARLQSLRSRLPFISQSALAQVLKEAELAPLPKACRRADIRDARNAVAKIATPYGPVHQQVVFDGASGPISSEIQHPFAILYHSCLSSKPMSDLIRRLATAMPPSIHAPWSIIFYTDEVLPGNQLAYRSSRKMWAVYWSVLEFGSAVLSDEAPTPFKAHRPAHRNATLCTR